MPYCWTQLVKTPDAPDWHLSVWPNRSLAPKGFVTFIGVTATLLALPLIAVLGSPVLWGLLPFIAGTIWLTWYFLRRSCRDSTLREDLTLWPDHVRLTRSDPHRPVQSWQASLCRIRADIHERGGPVDNYVTLSGAGRTVEIGAFLSPDERLSLYRDLSDRLRRIDINAR